MLRRAAQARQDARTGLAARDGESDLICELPGTRQLAAAAEVLTTLATLYRDGGNVACICRRCGHRATLATSDLIGFYGGTMTLRRLSDKLRCTQCGGRTAGASAEAPKP